MRNAVKRNVTLTNTEMQESRWLMASEHRTLSRRTIAWLWVASCPVVYGIAQLILYIDSLWERAPNQGLMLKVFLAALGWTFFALLIGAGDSRDVHRGKRTDGTKADATR